MSFAIEGKRERETNDDGDEDGSEAYAFLIWHSVISNEIMNLCRRYLYYLEYIEMHIKSVCTHPPNDMLFGFLVFINI